MRRLLIISLMSIFILLGHRITFALPPAAVTEYIICSINEKNKDTFIRMCVEGTTVHVDYMVPSSNNHFKCSFPLMNENSDYIFSCIQTYISSSPIGDGDLQLELKIVNKIIKGVALSWSN